MKKTAIAFLLFCSIHLVVVFILDYRKKEFELVQSRAISIDHRNIVPLFEILQNQERYIGKKVTVEGLLFTHEQGPHLIANVRSLGDNSISLSITRDSRIIAPPGLSGVWWFDSTSEGKPRGYSGVVEGVIRAGEVAATGNANTNPILEVIAAEVDFSKASTLTAGEGIR